MNPLTQLTADDSDLTAWALEHGPDYIRYAAERKFTVKAGTMDLIAEHVAVVLDGRLVREKHVEWKPREQAEAWLPKWEALAERIETWQESRLFPDFLPLPKQLTLELSTISRIEEKPEPDDPKNVLKYTGAVVKIRHPATADRVIVINFEASP